MGWLLSKEDSSEDLIHEIYLQSATVSLNKNPPVTILKAVLSEIKLDPETTKKNNSILTAFMDSLILHMKEKENLFNLFFQRLYYTGSFYSDLRILDPSEFDLNLVLKFPKETFVMEVYYDADEPSYLKCCLNNSNENFKKLMSQDYLDPSKVRNWLQSVIDRSNNSYSLPSKLKYDGFQIKLSSSGPSRTLTLSNNSTKIDIDLVPVFEIFLPTKPRGMDNRVFKLFEGKLKCFIVPKPVGYLDEKNSSLWRMHFPDIENKVLKNKGCAKSIIKLLKLLRNAQKWEFLASYYLKTIVLWLVLEEESQEFWNEINLDKRFIQALESLYNCLIEGKIPYFFNSNYNLIAKLNFATTYNVCNRLEIIIRNIKADMKTVINYFKVDVAFV